MLFLGRREHGTFPLCTIGLFSWRKGGKPSPRHSFSSSLATRESVSTGPVIEVSATSNPSERANKEDKSIPLSPSFQKAFLCLEQNFF
jgi:hypothetical protein